MATLWAQTLGDLSEPDFLWQLATLAFFLLVAAAINHLFGRHETARTRAWALGRGGLRRIALPLLTAALILAARPLLRQSMHVNVLSLALPLLFSLAGIRMVFYVLRHSFSASPWLNNFERGFAFAVWGLVAMYITGVLPEVIGVLEAVSFAVGKQHLNLWQIVQGVVTVLATVLGALWVGGLIESRLKGAAGLDSNLGEVLARLAKALLVLVAVLVSLPMVGIDLTTLSVFGGALGVGLGFGLQKIASNYVSGFIILLERSIRIGNFITVDGHRGEVTRITTRYTVLRSLVGVEALVPNELLVGSVVLNESYSDRDLRIAVRVQVSYDTDIALAEAVMLKAALAQPRVLAEPPPKVLLRAFADSGIDLELGFWISDPENGSGELSSDVNKEILRQFRTAGIVIPFPQREVRLLAGGSA